MLAGLSAPVPAVPARWLYDHRGSELFDEITRLPSYYPTRTETALLKHVMPELAARIPDGMAVVEFGAGSATKTPLLLEAIHPAAYVPVDISGDYLHESASEVAERFPQISVEPVVADFAREFDLPSSIASLPKLGFFPGSTIGNFEHGEAVAFLRAARRLLRSGAQFVIGVDLVKDPAVLVSAYDDAQGVTAAFNKNLLARINRELDGDFDLTAFAHRAIWNPDRNRIEMHLVSLKDQTARAAGRSFQFAEGETIHTENSHKFTPDSFSRLAREAGWRTLKLWTSPEPAFAVFMLAAD